MSLAMPATELVVSSPFDGEIVGRVATMTAEEIPQILARAERGRVIAAELSRNARGHILERAATILEDRREESAQLIVAESGKTINQARKEAQRAANTIRLSATEARQNAGEVIPFDSYAGSENRQGWFTREPLGIIMAITPFNDPLNIVAHKLGPAIAGGNSVILKPSKLTPLSAARLVDIFIEAGMPPEIVTVVHAGDGLVTKGLVSARDIRMVSFTGGFSAGESISRIAGLKRLAMDLGGNAPVIVFDDADLLHAVESCVSGAFWAAGQNCIGTQRILVQRSIYELFREAFVAASRALTIGDPRKEETDVGPMITADSARATQETVEMAIAAGGTLLTGNQLIGNTYQPTVVESVPLNCALATDEIFAPVVTLQVFDEAEEAIRIANDVEFSLHVGVFTTNLGRAMTTSRQLDAGGVMINDSSDYRFDGMPFGGAKYGSMGREGVHFAFEEMTQPKVICINS